MRAGQAVLPREVMLVQRACSRARILSGRSLLTPRPPHRGVAARPPAARPPAARLRAAPARAGGSLRPEPGGIPAGSSRAPRDVPPGLRDTGGVRPPRQAGGSRAEGAGGEPVRAAVRVEGTVQGVGFRPFVYGLATGLGLGGLVGNDADGVFAEV